MCNKKYTPSNGGIYLFNNCIQYYKEKDPPPHARHGRGGCYAGVITLSLSLSRCVLPVLPAILLALPTVALSSSFPSPSHCCGGWSCYHCWPLVGPWWWWVRGCQLSSIVNSFPKMFLVSNNEMKWEKKETHLWPKRHWHLLGLFFLFHLIIIPFVIPIAILVVVINPPLHPCPQALSSYLVDPCFHPMSSCSWWWLGVLWCQWFVVVVSSLSFSSLMLPSPVHCSLSCCLLVSPCCPCCCPLTHSVSRYSQQWW